MERTKLVSILRRIGIEVEERGSGRWVNFRCPFPHFRYVGGRLLVSRDTHPSAGALSGERGDPPWHCFGCKRKGVLSGLVSALLDKPEQRELRRQLLAEIAVGSVFLPGVDGPALMVDPEPEPLPEQLAEAFDRLAEYPEACAYLAARNIPLAVADAVGIRFDPDQKRIVFPIRGRSGELYGFSGRAIEDSTSPRIRDYFGLPKRSVLLGEHRWREGKPVFLVEGLFGWLHLVAIGAEEHANIAAALGSVLTQAKAERIARTTSDLYLVFDADDAGTSGIFGPVVDEHGRRDRGKGALALAQRNGLFVHVPAWPEGKSDPDQLDLDDVRAMLAVPVWEEEHEFGR